MKKFLIAAFLFAIALQGMAQHNPGRVNTYSDEDNGGGNGFRKQNLFVGGSLNLGYSGYDFNVGGAPEIGYSLNQWVDAGVLVNLNYTSERADPYYNDNLRQRNFTYGAGAFARVYPIRFLFFQVEPEFNWTRYSYKYFSPPVESGSSSINAASLLLGIGYGQRIVGRSNFYIAIMFDALQNQGSPYRDFNNSPLPVIKAGFDIYLHPGR